MRNLLIRISIFAFLLNFSIPGQAMITPQPKPVVLPMELIYKKIASMNVKEFQQMIGRKLTVKEKLGFWILKQKAKRQLKKKERSPEEAASQGQTAFIIAIAGVILLVIGLFVPYVIIGSLLAAIFAIVMGSTAKKKNPNDTKAHAAKLMGWLTLGVIALLFLIAAIIIASWSWY